MCKKLFFSIIVLISLCTLSFSPLKMYSPDGNKISVNAFTADSYLKEGWHAYPVCYVYSSDGSKEVISQEGLDVKKESGWYPYPVTTVYNTNGESKVVALSDGEFLLSDGWYPEKPALMIQGNKKEYVLQSETGKFRSDGWFVKEYIHDMPDLGNEIKNYISAKKGSYGIYIKNLSDGSQLILNDGKYKSASIIKLYVMAGVYNEYSKGNLLNNSAVTKHLNHMITISDNYSHNYLLKQIGKGNYKAGFDAVNKLCSEINCINTQDLSLFSGCGEYMAIGSNAVSPLDCGILLEKIYNGELISKEYSEEMLGLLKKQTRQSKIPYPLPKGTICANKTGENSSVESDVAIVYAPKCNYIICVITNNSPTAINDIRHISKLTYEYLNK